MSNRLQYETSPYLLQHKENPVDWYPWCDEAFESAKQMCKKVVNDFSDNTGRFYLYGNQNEELILRPKETYDGAVPSGNSLMSYNFVKLYLLTSDDKYKDLAEKQLDFISAEANSYPTNHAMFLTALLEYKEPPTKVIVVMDDKSDIKSISLGLPANAIINLLTKPTGEYSLKNCKAEPSLYKGRLKFVPELT